MYFLSVSILDFGFRLRRSLRNGLSVDWVRFVLRLLNWLDRSCVLPMIRLCVWRCWTLPDWTELSVVLRRPYLTTIVKFASRLVHIRSQISIHLINDWHAQLGIDNRFLLKWFVCVLRNWFNFNLILYESNGCRCSSMWQLLRQILGKIVWVHLLADIWTVPRVEVFCFLS